jgi:UPF0755 protein
MNYRKLLIIAATLGVLVIAALFFIFLSVAIPPKHEPTFIFITTGDNVDSVSRQAFNKGLVTSPGVLRSIMLWMGDEKKVKMGYYEFEKRQSIFRVAWRLMNGSYGYDPVKVTLPEGSDYKKAASIFAAKFPNYTVEEFEKVFKENEGYIFPETYFFPPRAWPGLIVERARSEFKSVFDNVIKTLKKDEGQPITVTDAGIEVRSKIRSNKEIVIMASILEGEANTAVDRRLVAGILWKRIDIGMPLQVDATLRYVTGRGSAELTKSDLASKDLYNTYTNKGLPPTPISNPGKDALVSSIQPEESNYLYFLTGDDGKMYYAKTHDEHVKLKEKYIK